MQDVAAAQILARRQGWFKRCALALFCAALCVIFSQLNTIVYRQLQPRRAHSLTQAHYQNPLYQQDQKILKPQYWVELGKNSTLGEDRLPARGHKIWLEGFEIGSGWNRAVPWYVYANNSGMLRFEFPPDQVQAVGVFMTDGDSYWRMGRIRSQGFNELAQGLHDGRWYFIPLTTEERSKGEVRIYFDRYTGSNIALSAAALF
ncbi:hypothetical protein JNK13_01200 [bacterium]|nr:hypothetical protein [bacterium]